jgi:predicted Ser/Thr protein kinase
MASTTLKDYTVAALTAATNNFHTIIGEGNYGSVYAGTLEGKAVAVKCLSTPHREQEMEVERKRSTLLHERLVPCLGLVRAPPPGWSCCTVLRPLQP